MVVEIDGQRLGIRLESPEKFGKFRTIDVGRKGRLQLIRGYSKKLGWKTQSIVMNLSTYRNIEDAFEEVWKIKGLTPMKRIKAIQKIRNWFMINRG